MNPHGITLGMPVYDHTGTYLGAVQHHDNAAVTFDGRVVPLGRILRVTAQGVVLAPPTDHHPDSGAVAAREPNARLAHENPSDAEKPRSPEHASPPRATAVAARHPQLEIAREVVRVSRRDIAERLLSPLEAASAFSVGSIRIPVRVEEVRVGDQPVFTGEAVVHQEPRVDRDQVDGKPVHVVADVALDGPAAGANEPSSFTPLSAPLA